MLDIHKAFEAEVARRELQEIVLEKEEQNESYAIVEQCKKILVDSFFCAFLCLVLSVSPC